jgi:hypothetical protein
MEEVNDSTVLFAMLWNMIPELFIFENDIRASSVGQNCVNSRNNSHSPENGLWFLYF